MSVSKQDALVSICVTAYNYARFLPACLDSILSQSYRQIECIVVDDASSDETPDVLARYGTRLHAIRHEKSRGQLAAMITGFQQSRGQFVCFADADDLFYRDFIATNVAVHQSPETFAAMSTSLQHIIDADGHVMGIHPTLVLRRLQRLPRSSYRRRSVDCRDFGVVPITLYDPQANYAYQWLWGTTSSMMFRRDALTLALMPGGGLLERFRISADAYLAPLCHALGGTVMIEAPLSAYRRHGSNSFADNLVIGGLSPLSMARGREENPRPYIAAQIETHRGDFCRALGPRRFVSLVEKFCQLTMARHILSDPELGIGFTMTVLFYALHVSRQIRVNLFRLLRLWGMVRFGETP